MGSRDLERGGAKTNNPPGNYSSSYYQETSEKQWTSWLVPMFVVANVAMFVVVMFVNNCPKHNLGSEECVARFLGRFSFEPLRVNPLFGPSSSTWVFWSPLVSKLFDFCSDFLWTLYFVAVTLLLEFLIEDVLHLCLFSSIGVFWYWVFTDIFYGCLQISVNLLLLLWKFAWLLSWDSLLSFRLLSLLVLGVCQELV